MNTNQTQFDKDMASEFSALFLQIRDILLSFDDIVETKKPRITTYSDPNGGICHMRTTAKGVDIGYLKGAQMDDKFNQLTGKTKKMRVQTIPSHANLNESIIRDYINQGIMLNRKN